MKVALRGAIGVRRMVVLADGQRRKGWVVDGLGG